MWKQAKEEGVGWWFWFWPNRQEELYHNRDSRFARHSDEPHLKVYYKNSFMK
jgi:hypothetical protein